MTTPFNTPKADARLATDKHTLNLYERYATHTLNGACELMGIDFMKLNTLQDVQDAIWGAIVVLQKPPDFTGWVVEPHYDQWVLMKRQENGMYEVRHTCDYKDFTRVDQATFYFVSKYPELFKGKS